MTPFQAAIEGTREIGLAVMATTLSLHGGVRAGRLHGRHRRPLHVLVRADGGVRHRRLAARLVHADADAQLAVDQDSACQPKGGHTSSKDSAVFRPIDRTYMAMLRWSMAHRGVSCSVCVLVIASIVPLFMVVGKNFLPVDDQSRVRGQRAPRRHGSGRHARRCSSAWRLIFASTPGHRHAGHHGGTGGGGGFGEEERGRRQHRLHLRQARAEGRANGVAGRPDGAGARCCCGSIPDDLRTSVAGGRWRRRRGATPTFSIRFTARILRSSAGTRRRCWGR